MPQPRQECPNRSGGFQPNWGSVPAQRQRRFVDSPGFLNPGFWNPILRRTLKGFCPSQAQPTTDRTPSGFDRRMDSQTQGSRTLGWPTESRWDSPIADSPRRGLGGWATWRGHRRRRPSWWIATTPAALLAEPLRKAKLPTARPGVRISLASGQGKSARSSSNQINAHLRGVEPVVAVVGSPIQSVLARSRETTRLGRSPTDDRLISVKCPGRPPFRARSCPRSSAG